MNKFFVQISFENRKEKGKIATKNKKRLSLELEHKQLKDVLFIYLLDVSCINQYIYGQAVNFNLIQPRYHIDQNTFIGITKESCSTNEQLIRIYLHNLTSTSFSSNKWCLYCLLNQIHTSTTTDMISCRM